MTKKIYFETFKKCAGSLFYTTNSIINFQKVFYCLLSAYSFDISQSEFLESNTLEVEILIKHLFNHNIN